MHRNLEISKKQMWEILLVTFVIGVAVLISDFVNTNLNFDDTVNRNEAGAGSHKENLKVEFLDEKEELEVEVSDKRLSDKELKKAFDRAIEEIDQTYLGQNKTANNVTYDLDLRSSYLDGLIEADWKFDTYGVISTDGKLREENIPKEGVVVNITGILYYEEEESIYSFSVVVNQKSLKTLDGQLAAINRAVRDADETSRGRNKLSLPTRVEGMEVAWKKKMNFRGLQIILLGIIAVVALKIGKKRDEAKAVQVLIAEKEQDYPMIVSQLSILMGAGMSFRKALERIVAKYLAGIKKGAAPRAGFEEIVKTYRKMVDGKGDLQALEDLGRTSESKEYRKLAMMLSQNLRKGSRDLLNALEKEEKYAFEMRKQRAVRAGEEASTKLLVPMGGMLFIVIVILVVPAIMQMNI